MSQIKITELHLHPDLKSKTQWHREGFKLKKDAVASHWAYQQFTHEAYDLYDKSQVEPRKTMNEDEKQALKKQFEKGLTCVRCGNVAFSHHELDKDKVCESCHDEERELTRKMSWVRSFKELLSDEYVILDTATSGTSAHDEIVELSIISMTGEVLYTSTFNPVETVSYGASELHGLTNERLKDSPSFAAEWPKIVEVLANKKILTYGASFDIGMIESTLNKYDIDFDEVDEVGDFKCVMNMYSRFSGDTYYNIAHTEYVSTSANKRTYRATDDCLLVLELIKNIANFK